MGLDDPMVGNRESESTTVGIRLGDAWRAYSGSREDGSGGHDSRDSERQFGDMDLIVMPDHGHNGLVGDLWVTTTAAVAVTTSKALGWLAAAARHIRRSTRNRRIEAAQATT